MENVKWHHLHKQAQVVGLLGFCLSAISLPRLSDRVTLPDCERPPVCLLHAPAPHSPSAVALWTARRYRTHAKLAVNQTREALEAWDPASLANTDAEAWRLAQMAADPVGDLASAASAARHGAALARTPGEAAAAAELLVMLDHEMGYHRAELCEARDLIRLQPHQPRARMVFRRAERCFAACRPTSPPAPPLQGEVGLSAQPGSGHRPAFTLPGEGGRSLRPGSSYLTSFSLRAEGGLRPSPGSGHLSPHSLQSELGHSSPPGGAHPAPPSLAGKGAGGLGPANDPRLDQKVWIHATDQRIADLLADLTRATGVTLVPGMEVADERVSFWADAIPLKDAMRDLRHVHGYYWSRAKRHGEYAYSLWQDTQSRAREEAEIQRLALEQQRQFQEEIWKHVRALHASDAELKRLAQEDPYFVAQMIHPAVRAGYQLFAALSPDQQAQLLQGQTPSRSLPSGEVLDVSPLVSFSFPSVSHPGQTITLYPRPESWLARRAPQGDVISLSWAEMTPSERAAVTAIVHGAGLEQDKEANLVHPGTHPASAAALRDAEMPTATTSVFRWGEEETQGISLQVDFQSGERPWRLYSNITVTDSARKFYDDLLRKGEFRVWPGSQDEVDRFLGPRGAATAAVPTAVPTGAAPPDPLLDALVSLVWRLPLRGGRPVLLPDELLDALSRQLGRPFVLDARCPPLRLPHGSSPVFRWEKRPLREILHRFFPGWELSSSGGAIFFRDPDRLRGRIHQVPPAVAQLLQDRKGPLTLDDAALLARSLSPWQLVRLFLPSQAVDEMLAARDLLRLYGELAPAQRAMLADGLPFSSLTPPQQALFLQFAERQRPFLEAWRFQQGALRLVAQPPPAPPAGPDNSPRPVARSLFEVSLQPGDSQSFPVDLFPPSDRSGWPSPHDWIGKPFPFPALTTPERQFENPTWKPVLANLPLRGRAAVVLLWHPFVSPYVGIQPPPSPVTWAQDLTDRLRGASTLVIDVRLGAAQTVSDLPRSSRLAIHQPYEERTSPQALHFEEDGDEQGQPLDSMGSGAHIEQSPTVAVIGPDGVVQAVFEGDDAWNVAAVETAVRRSAPARVLKSPRLPARQLAAP